MSCKDSSRRRKFPALPMSILPKTRSQLAEEIEQKDSRISDLEAENAELKQDLEAAQSNKKDDEEKTKLQSDLAKAQSESAAKDKEIAELKGKLAAAESAVKPEAVAEQVKLAIAEPEKEENAPIAKIVNDEVANRVASAGHAPLPIDGNTADKNGGPASNLTGLDRFRAAIAGNIP